MKLKNLPIVIFLLSISSFLFSQDILQTNYRYAPLSINPAQSGGFYGTYRVGGSYRDQGKSFLGEGYQTWQAFVDMPIKFAFRDMDWIGVGIHSFGDKAGILSLKTNATLIDLAYHYSMDKKQKQILSFGVQYGFVQKKLDANEVVVENNAGEDIKELQDYKSSYTDINFGLTYRMKLKKDQSFVIGVAAFHLLKPKFDGLSEKNYIEPRITLHSNYYYKVNDRIYIQPEIVASFSGKAYNIMPQFKTFYKLKKNERKKEFNDKIYFGVGYRLEDALQLMIGFNYKGYDFGFSYDITVSSAAKFNNNKGGLEIGVFKIFNVLKRPKVKPVMFCPRL